MRNRKSLRTRPPPGNRTIAGRQSGRCVDISNSTTVNGAAAVIRDRNGQTGQQWSLRS